MQLSCSMDGNNRFFFQKLIEFVHVKIIVELIIGFLKLAVAVSFASVLHGCFSNKYDAPNDGPVANLTLSTNANKLRVQVFADRHCTKSAYGNRLAYFSEETNDNREVITKQILAEKEFIFTFAQDISERHKCNVTLAFVPEIGKTYHAKYNLIEGRKCNAHIYLESKDNNGNILLESEPSMVKNPMTCINNLTD